MVVGKLQRLRRSLRSKLQVRLSQASTTSSARLPCSRKACSSSAKCPFLFNTWQVLGSHLTLAGPSSQQKKYMASASSPALPSLTHDFSASTGVEPLAESWEKQQIQHACRVLEAQSEKSRSLFNRSSAATARTLMAAKAFKHIAK